MKKKIKLTESQYNRLQELLFENKFDNIVSKLEQTKVLDFEEKLDAITKILGTTNHQQAYDKIESITSKSINDLLIHADYDEGIELVNALIKAYQERSAILNQQLSTKNQQSSKTQQNKPSDINHILDFANVGDNLKFKTSQNTDFSINVVSVNQDNNEILGDNYGNKIKMSFNAFDDKTKKLNYQELNKNTNQFENKTGDIIGLEIERNGQPIQIPNAGGSNYPLKNPPVNQNDETPYTIELDPNSTNPDELKAAGEAARKTIDYSKDPLLQKAFYRQEKFWDQFKAELSGKKPDPKGIKPVLDMLGKYMGKRLKEKFGDTFVPNEWLRLEILTSNSLAQINKKTEMYVRSWSYGDAETVTLKDSKHDYSIVINQRRKDSLDIYEAIIKADKNGGEIEEPILIKCYESAGYRPPITGNEKLKTKTPR
jgi:hypothetical protein